MVTVQLRTPVSYAAVIDGPDVAAFAVRETTPAAAPKPRLLDCIREAIRTRHDNRRTEKTYVAWIRRYIFFHGMRQPADMAAAEIIYTHVLNRGPAGVRSPVDRVLDL